MPIKLSVVERMKLKRLIDQELDGLYERASNLGKDMGRLFTLGNRSQLRNLETVAAAATRTSILKNHIKNQTGKDRLRYEQNQTWAKDDSSLGRQAMKLLDDLRSHAITVVTTLEIDTTDEKGKELSRTLEIELQRGVIQTAVCAALYGDLGAPL